MQLDKIRIKNFKSLHDVKLDLKKITILIGPNSGGKSSVLQILALMKQSIIEAGGGYFRPSGDIVNLGAFSDIVYNHDSTKSIKVSVGGKILLPESFKQAFGAGPAKFQYDLSTSAKNHSDVYFALSQGSLDIVCETQNRRNMQGKFSTPKGDGTLQLSNPNDLLPGYTVHESPGGAEIEVELINQLLANSETIKKIFASYFFVPPARTMDEYGLPVVNVYDNEIVKSTGQRTNLSRLVSYLSSSPPNVTEMISNWTYKLFEKRIKTRNVPTRNDENKETTNVTIEFLENEHYNSIMNDGSGTNQVILLLTLLGITPKGSILGIEEPEIHLHPKAQSDLAKILIDVSKKDNKQLIFTTHSEHMLYPFLTSIASKDENSLTLDDVGIFYCEKDSKTKQSSITPLEIDENGMILGGLKGFFESEVKALNEYMQALEND